MKRALITGIGGQDGYLLSRFLLEKGYEVHGFVRTSSYSDPERRLWRIYSLLEDQAIKVYPISLNEYTNIYDLVEEISPDECYHFASQNHVNDKVLGDDLAIINTNVYGTHFLFSALKKFVQKQKKECRIFFPASSEIFGYSKAPQNENTPFQPRNLYGISKLIGMQLARYYRKEFNLYICNGILYNHESKYRGLEYVTRKISYSAARIRNEYLNHVHPKLIKKLLLGNINSKRDWGYAGDYVEAMWNMLQQNNPDDYVIATGSMHTIQEFLEIAFSMVDLDWNEWIDIDGSLYREEEGIELCGDSKKAKRILNLRQSISFDGLVKEMVLEDIKRISINRVID